LLGKETIIHTDHKPLQLPQAQTKLQKSQRYRWMGFLQKFHLVIKYKKGTSNKVVDMLSRPPIVASIILKNTSLSHDRYVEKYVIDEDFKEVYEKITHGAQVENNFLQEKQLYHLGKLCIPTSERVHVIQKAHTSLVSGHFGVGKTMDHLQRFSYWPQMKAIVTKYVKRCVMCSTCKPNNRKLGLYSPLLIPSHPWESISMDFVEGLTMSKGGHDYMYVVVNRFSKMCILIPCKKKITTEKTVNIFFQYVWGFTLGYPHPLSWIKILNSLGTFGQACGE
jgi:hypothetical protein